MTGTRISIPVDGRCWYSDVLMLDRNLQCAAGIAPAFINPTNIVDIDPMLGQWWFSVFDAGSALSRQWINISVLLTPRNHKTLTQCWSNVGPASVTLLQHWVNVSRSCYADIGDISFPTQQTQDAHSTNVNPTLIQRLVTAGSLCLEPPLGSKHEALIQCGVNVVDGGPTLNHHWVNIPCLLGYNQIKYQDDQGTQDIDTMLDKCWIIVYDYGPSSTQH